MQQPSVANTNKKLINGFLFLLSTSGFIISSYLLYQHYLIINEANGTADVCNAVFGRGCGRALSSTVAVQLGLPLAGWGIIYYAVLLILLIVFSRRKKTTTYIFLLAISLAGCIVSITLLMMIYFDHALFCPFCVMIHGINLVTFFFIIKLKPYACSFPKQKNEFKVANANKNVIKWRHVLSLMSMILFLYVAIHLLLIPRNIIFDDKEFIKQFDNSPQQKIIVDAEDPVYGYVKAPVQIIVFSDFECAACRYFSQVTRQLEKKYNGQFYIVFKHFPLGKECNPVFGDLHPHACGAARAAEAARLQQKFWAYHDLLFSLQTEKTNEAFLSLAEKAGLNKIRFETDRESEMVKSRVAKTIAQGSQAGVKSTPAVFLNGRRVNDFRLLHMQVLIEHLVK